jgi:hypothetical protein
VPVFSKFGVVEEEIRGFLNKIEEYSILPIVELTKWMYSEGVILYHATQEEITRETAKLHQSMTISSGYLIGAKFLSLMKLLPAILKIFAPNTPTAQIVITTVFNNFLVEALHKHIEFYAIQADVTNDFHKFCLENNNATAKQKHDYVVQRFRDYKIISPELSHEIEDHILLMSEHKDYKESQQEQVLAEFAERKIIEMDNLDSEATSSTATTMASLTRASMDSPLLQPHPVVAFSRRMSMEFSMVPSMLSRTSPVTTPQVSPVAQQAAPVLTAEEVAASCFDWRNIPSFY